ncbi:oxygen-independent coproporphyrinogen III oxidase [Bdellovibrio bacteriovorus]|uniref:Coproporphyrinogen-III oxidase n=1 Tax=Bdellovibrio bacteriovorus (strain ATCC 15356 / DSM 50701 / NCIMB 9529 / HD100) TaxID=264462 RepID=Q6MHT5_BDEBA|nr:oxygen-independent coproporphyrinogen III oxidase [Bdellovibrio bacteriovorus]AHZ83808.1 coproporphyrinogen III oxidase [Bdellovibrio bacteriovorus]BEV69781.1 Oxygen-independent coproporphyrinogen III oxidase [Bdellovibrio bacteriovorus]CAE78247.1 oxygen-independent coproporphyrinogen III oxidase [Bdellovibrio bacteriovorus HD100]
MMKDLLAKYDVPVPRYTSYPTVPYWETNPTTDQWVQHLRATLKEGTGGWSLYLHIPFCESLCTFCGCNNIITKDHKRETPYVDMVLKEWQLYLDQVPELLEKPLKHIHLGGGTPTFLSAEALTQLLKPILSRVKIDTHDFEGSIEVDPRRTNAAQLKALRELGFNRVSMGVQDFHPEVQRLVNRIQPLEITQKLTQDARDMGYTSVNFDLIYGLARQTPESITETAKATVALRPDRIALYSFALVPWIKPAQRLFKDEDLPKASEKRRLYEIARGILIEGGYVEVGMDHFALPTDNLCIAMNEKRLHRNFMGYTDQRTDVLLGMGVSSISETPYSFHQNEKVLPLYEAALNEGRLPTLRGHILTEEDKVRREQILNLMTNFEVPFVSEAQENQSKEFLAEMIKDELVEIKDHKLMVNEAGRPFLRNACAFFDERLKTKQPQTKIFSQSI